MADSKIVNQAAVWHKHGKHKGRQEIALQMNRERQEASARRTRAQEMFGSIQEALGMQPKKRNRRKN